MIAFFIHPSRSAIALALALTLGSSFAIAQKTATNPPKAPVGATATKPKAPAEASPAPAAPATAIAAPAPAPAKAHLSNPTSARIVFSATGFPAMSFKGTTSQLAIADDGTTIVFSVPLSTLTTTEDGGPKLRDEHMKGDGYLNVEKYPNAVLKVAWSEVSPLNDGESSSGVAKAAFTLHGVEKEVSVKYVVKRQDGQIEASGDFEVDITSYGIKKPNYLGIGVKQNIPISVTFKTKAI